jgi:hypothetical protein
MSERSFVSVYQVCSVSIGIILLWVYEVWCNM